MFVDNGLIICMATKQTAYTLDHFCNVLSQLVNNHKSEVQFSKGIKQEVRKEIFDILQTTPTNIIDTYLVCSNIDRNRTKTDIIETKHKIRRKANRLEA